MYGVCNRNSASSQNCLYDGPGKRLNDIKAEEILQNRCVDFFKDSNSTVCCNAEQVFTMEESIQMAEGIFGRCQSCMRNLLKGICGIACDPHQSKYLNVLETKTGVFGTYANKVEYLIDREYTENVYESCKRVIHPSSGRLALDLACGTEATKCTAEKFFFFMGDPIASPLVPFKIEYIYSENPDLRFTSKTKKCDEAFDNSYACSCVDCPASCPIGNTLQPEDSGFLLMDLNGTTFIVAIIIGSFGTIGILLGMTLWRNMKLANLPMFFGGFDEVNTELSRVFCWWGKSMLDQSFFEISIHEIIIVF